MAYHSAKCIIALQIRFFERVKFERRIKQLERELRAVDPGTDASGDLPARLAQAKDDLKVANSSLTARSIPHSRQHVHCHCASSHEGLHLRHLGQPPREVCRP